MNKKSGVGAIVVALVVLAGCGVGDGVNGGATGAETGREAQALGTAQGNTNQGNTNQGNTNQGNTNQGNTNQGRMLLVWRVRRSPLFNATYTYYPPPVVTQTGKQAGAAGFGGIFFQNPVTVGLSSLSLVHSELRGVSSNGISITGSAFRDVELGFESDNGSTGRLRVVGSRMDTDPSVNMLLPAYGQVSGVSTNALDLRMYNLQYKSGTSWVNLCGADPSGDANRANTALVFSGYWNADGSYHDDPNYLSVSCWDGVVAKCARWGYQPWKSLWGHDPQTDSPGVYNMKSLKPVHLACARAAMADYCGNGIAHTEYGTPIDISDRYGFIPKVPESSSLMFSDEGTFDQNGVICLARERYNRLGAECPGNVVVVPPMGGPSCPGTGGGGHFLAQPPECRETVITIQPFDRGSLASCNGNGIQYVTIANTLETCSHSPYVSGPSSMALARDCNSCTTSVCNALPDCCQFASNGDPIAGKWSQVCINKANALCNELVFTAPIASAQLQP